MCVCVVHRAALAIEEMESMLTALVGGRSLVLPFCGIGHFKQEVAFIQIEEGEHLSTLTHIAGEFSFISLSPPPLSLLY